MKNFTEDKKAVILPDFSDKEKFGLGLEVCGIYKCINKLFMWIDIETRNCDQVKAFYRIGISPSDRDLWQLSYERNFFLPQRKYLKSEIVWLWWQFSGI